MPKKRRWTKMLYARYNFSYFLNEEQFLGLNGFFGVNWTNLGPKSVNLIFYAPNVANLGFWRIVPTIAL